MHRGMNAVLAAIARLCRYFRYLVISFKLESYRSWTNKGEPCPLPKPRRRLKSTTESEILHLFAPALNDLADAARLRAGGRRFSRGI